MFVYFFEYTIITCFAKTMKNNAERKYPEQADDFSIKEYFVLLNNCY